MTLPVDYANATVSLDNHPDAHNATNSAVNALDDRVSDLEVAGGATILDGTGPPAETLGVEGDYYVDTTNRILYGPRGIDLATGERITSTTALPPSGVAGSTFGIRITFNATGTITRVRYYRTAAASDALTIKVWHSSGTLLDQVTDTQAGQTGWFEVTLPTPIPVVNTDIRIVSVGNSVGQNVPYQNTASAPTGTASMTYSGYRETGGTTIPSSVSGGAFYIEPTFHSGPGVTVWPAAVGAVVTFLEQALTPANPTADTQIVAYCKDNKIVYAYNNAGTMRYKSLDMASAGVTWVDHGSTAP